LQTPEPGATFVAHLWLVNGVLLIASTSGTVHALQDLQPRSTVRLACKASCMTLALRTDKQAALLG
jgi:hypothetical protein